MLDAELESAIRARFDESEFARWMGMRLAALGDGTSELRLDLAPHHLNPGGIAHGGIGATMLDAAIGLAQRTRLGMGSSHVTVHLGIDYLRPAATGTLVARGTAVRSGARMSFGEAELLDGDDTLLAKGSATFLVVEGSARGDA